MYKNKSILAIIPARGGSKRIPKKNTKLFCNKPLIQYSVDAAIKSKYIDKLVVSTDDPIIKDLLKEIQIIQRPDELARDDSSSISVYYHVLEYLKETENYIPDIIVALQPTSPLREVEDIDSQIEKFINYDADSSCSVTRVRQHPAYVVRMDSENNAFPIDEQNIHKRSQDLPELYIENGAVFCFKLNTLKVLKTQYGPKHKVFAMDEIKSIDIDEELDWEFAELIMNKKEDV